MPIDPTALANLLAYARVQRADCAMYVKVTWSTSPSVINYYGTAAWNSIAPFTGIGQTIEPRLIPKKKDDPFLELEINPDLRTENVNLEFDDIDKAITTKFQTYGSGVTCEIFLYYPEPDPLTISIWYGQLQAPQVYGWKTLKAVATNGYKSREFFTPSRRRPKECTANVFGGLLPDQDAIDSSLCPYNRHIPGGTVGNFKTGSTPYADCPKLTVADCTARLSNNGLYYGGFITDAVPLRGSPRTSWLAHTKGNASKLPEPIRVIFGEKYVRENYVLAWSIQDPHVTRGIVRILWEICEGPVSQIINFKVNGRLVGQNDLNFRLGSRGQSRSNYAPNISNFSSTAHVFSVYGHTPDPLNTTPDDYQAECQVKGFSEVCVYTDDDPVTKTRIWSDNRVWCLLELYRNQKFGIGYKEDQFTILDWMTAATWSDVTVSHTVTFPDGETQVFVSRRSTFNAVLEGRPLGEQVEDICRSGGLSVPFQHEGDFTIRAIRKATTDELNNARIFYDEGVNVNIVWDGQPAITLSQTPDNKVVNEVEVRFEEAANLDNERPITVDDPNQKLKAGRQLGANYFLAVPKKFTGFGITALNEAVRFAYRMLWFGEFDEGGTQNNLRLELRVPFEQVLGVKRYEIIKVVSDLLDGFTIGLGSNAETPQYFRVLKIKRIAGNRAEITAQAYNHTAYTNFEVDSVSTPGGQFMYVTEAGTLLAQGAYAHTGTTDGKPAYWNYNQVILAWKTSASRWEFQYDGGVLYYSTDAVATPNLVTTWTQGTGALPLPVVSNIRPPIDPPCDPPFANSMTYDAATGMLSIPPEEC